MHGFVADEKNHSWALLMNLEQRVHQTLQGLAVTSNASCEGSSLGFSLDPPRAPRGRPKMLQN